MQYNLIRAGMVNAREHGISGAEIFQALDAQGRLFQRVGDQSLIVLSGTQAGRHLIVLLTEADLEPDVWDVTAAREMTLEEIRHYTKALGGPDA